MSASSTFAGAAAEFAARLRAVDVDVVGGGGERREPWRALPHDATAVARVIGEARRFLTERANPGASGARLEEPCVRLVPLGGGTRLATARPDLARAGACERALFIDLGRLTGVVEYEPGDGTLTARAGTPWEELAEVVAKGGHDLTPDVTRRGATTGVGSGRSTLGGVLGAAASGPDQLQRGPVRHHVLGAEVATASGTLARSGGRLVKNVTGFDVFRLHVGAGGTLGVLTEASLRLMPRAESDVVVVVDGLELDDALTRAEALRRSGLNPRASWVTNVMRDGCTLAVHISGRARQVERDTQTLVDTLGGRRLDDDAARRQAQELRDTRAGDGGLALRLRGVPSAVAEMTRVARAWSIEQQRSLPVARRLEPQLLAWPGVGDVRLALPASLDLDVSPTAIANLMQEMQASGASVVPEGVPIALHAAFAAAAPPRPALGWEHALRAGMDPQRLFTPRPMSAVLDAPTSPAVSR